MKALLFPVTPSRKCLRERMTDFSVREWHAQGAFARVQGRSAPEQNDFVAWEMLGIDLESPYIDQRPLLVATQPEVREYRLQFYEDAGPSGDFTAVQSITVSP